MSAAYRHIEPKDLWTKETERLLVDVRTPAEFEKGHIPGAVNIPLFSNEERISVGTTYKQENPRKAFLLGLEIVGPKMAVYVKQLDALDGEKKINCYCWRGGQRSQSMAWLFQKAGYQVNYIQGGYKAYRNYIQQEMATNPLPVIILGGRTGCGKSMILDCLKKKGEQVIDLESMAQHKGSAFGGIEEDEQPSTEHFENLLYQNISTLDTGKRIWVENESRLVGDVHLPQAFWNLMKSAPVVYIDFPVAERLRFLVKTYGHFPIPDLKAAFGRIKKRLGGLGYQKALDFLDEKDIKNAAQIAQGYYDKSYTYLLETNKAPNIYQLAFEQMDFPKNAQALIEFVKKKKINTD